MNMTRMMVAVLIAGSGLALNVTQAQQPGIKRTDALRHDLGVPGREVIQVRVDFAPEWRSQAHASGRRDRLRPRRHAGISARGQAAGDAQGREACSSRPERSTRRRTSAPATRRNSPRNRRKRKPLVVRKSDGCPRGSIKRTIR